MKTATPQFLIAVLIVCLVSMQKGQAVSPSPDGGYPNFNTAEGQNSLFSLTTGVANTAIGWSSLYQDTDGSFNTGVGAGTLLFNVGDQTTGDGTSNTAIGTAALVFNTTGSENTAVGTAALANNDSDGNAAFGAFALNANSTGIGNTASGARALVGNTAGNFNTAIGSAALAKNTIGLGNTAIGVSTLFNNTIGDGNVALGTSAGLNVSTASRVVCIRSDGGNVDDTTWIGNIYGVTTQSGTTAPVIVSDDGQLGTVVSSERFKKDIVPMQKASDAILSLRPVTFHYKTDGGNTPQFGLIAEEVSKVNPALVLSDKEGKPYTVRYDAVNAMLLNEFLKEHRTVQELKSIVAKQEANAIELQKQIEALAAVVQKVSAQVQLNKPHGERF